ncbi:hypothetical protein A2U01_0047215, partial [Trifolium medium]|nr:hypothetical protein [Trifolium medium]
YEYFLLQYQWPPTLCEYQKALQQASLGGIGLKVATSALQGMSCTSAEKNVLEQGVLLTCATNVTII